MPRRYSIDTFTVSTLKNEFQSVQSRIERQELENQLITSLRLHE